MTGRKNQNRRWATGRSALESQNASFKIWSGHPLGFSAASPSPDPSPSHHPLNSRFGLTGIDLSYILSIPSPNETKIIGDGPTVTPQHYMMCNRAGEGTCLWRGLGTVNVSQRLLRAGHICHGCQNREMSDISHGVTFLHFPWSGFFSSLPAQKTGACKPHCWRSL